MNRLYGDLFCWGPGPDSQVLGYARRRSTLPPSVAGAGGWGWGWGSGAGRPGGGGFSAQLGVAGRYYACCGRFAHVGSDAAEAPHSRAQFAATSREGGNLLLTMP
eukprot:COSAG02_NODE_1144_length_14244_cov_16.832096_13_plen_105_part_00